jgi:phenylpropionate dioxygenase-like ring-hydroxylating dioxygenase large terminal subunit
MYIRNTWYAAAWSREVGRSLLARTYLNEPVLLYRREDGTPVAIQDRCCHRRLPLSFGSLIGDTVQCGYHGFVFDATGQCVSIPNQDFVPEQAVIRAFPLAERYGLVWIWMGDPAKADPATIPDFSILEDPRQAWKGTYMKAKAHYQLMNDNLNDLSHLTFVHGTTIGNYATALAEITIEQGDDFVRQTRWMIDRPPPPTYKRLGGFEGNVDRWQIVTFRPPCFTWLHTGGADTGTGAPQGHRQGGIGLWNVNAITPETDKSSHYFWAQTHDMHIDDKAITESLFNDIHTAFSQDLVVFEAQQNSIDLAPDEPEISCKADRAQLITRRLVRIALEREQAAMAG